MHVKHSLDVQPIWDPIWWHQKVKSLLAEELEPDYQLQDAGARLKVKEDKTLLRVQGRMKDKETSKVLAFVVFQPSRGKKQLFSTAIQTLYYKGAPEERKENIQ